MTDGPEREALRTLVAGLAPFDQRETADRDHMLQWIDSGGELYRRVPPDQPPQHLVTYFLPYHAATDSLCMISHRRAGRWLPPGGHVEPGETPWATVVREADEELAITARPHPLTPDGSPWFLTVTQTVGPHVMNSRGVSRDDPSQLAGRSPRVGRMRVRPSKGRHVSQGGRRSLQKRHRDLGCGRAERPATTGNARRIRPAIRDALAGLEL